MIDPTTLSNLLEIASHVDDSISNDSQGSIDGNRVYLETLANEINKFFDKAKASFVDTTIKIYNAKVIKPKNCITVLVDGGCAYWDGDNWRTLMDINYNRTFPIIEWEVKWWAELPKNIDFF